MIVFPGLITTINSCSWAEGFSAARRVFQRGRGAKKEERNERGREEWEEKRGECGRGQCVEEELSFSLPQRHRSRSYPVSVPDAFRPLWMTSLTA